MIPSVGQESEDEVLSPDRKLRVQLYIRQKKLLGAVEEWRHREKTGLGPGAFNGRAVIRSYVAARFCKSQGKPALKILGVVEGSLPTGLEQGPEPFGVLQRGLLPLPLPRT